MKNNHILECMYAFCIGHLFVTWIFLTDSLKDSAHWSHSFMNQTTVVILQVCCYVQPERMIKKNDLFSICRFTIILWCPNFPSNHI